MEGMLVDAASARQTKSAKPDETYRRPRFVFARSLAVGVLGFAGGGFGSGVSGLIPVLVGGPELVDGADTDDQESKGAGLAKPSHHQVDGFCPSFSRWRGRRHLAGILRFGTPRRCAALRAV
jgi:hypothetical protein